MKNSNSRTQFARCPVPVSYTHLDVYKRQFKDCTESPPPKVRGKILSVFQIYSLINRLLIVNRVKQGETIAHLSKKYHINKIQILVMARMWDTYDRFSIRNGRIVVPH